MWLATSLAQKGHSCLHGTPWGCGGGGRLVIEPRGHLAGRKRKDGPSWTGPSQRHLSHGGRAESWWRAYCLCYKNTHISVDQGIKVSQFISKKTHSLNHEH